MQGNRRAYEAAYRRTLNGERTSLLELVMRPFEDAYTRESRLRGERDGAAARAAAGSPL